MTSIDRGASPETSIIGILDRLHPLEDRDRVTSSPPQVRYPDYYGEGIDMSRMNEFVAFKAAVALLKKNRAWNPISPRHTGKPKKQQAKEEGPIVNYIEGDLCAVHNEEISAKMVDLLTPASTRAQSGIVTDVGRSARFFVEPSGRLGTSPAIPAQGGTHGEQCLHTLWKKNI